METAEAQWADEPLFSELMRLQPGASIEGLEQSDPAEVSGEPE